MRLLNLARIRTALDHVEEVYPPETFEPDRESFSVAAPVSLVFDIHKDAQEFRLVGRVQTVLELPCSRCLEPFRTPVDAAFDLRYLPRPQGAGEAEREIDDDDFSTAFYENDTIDLVELMQEQCYLSLPMKPLCGGDCRGLCPVCGTNLNRGTCHCTIEWTDPRLAALKR